MKVHILGAGSIGSLVATSLAYAPRNPDFAVSVILRSKNKLQQYLQNGSTMKLDRNLGSRVTIERQFAGVTADQLKHGELENLVVTTPSCNSYEALKSVRHAISPATTILFVQNGMGVQEQVVSKLWPDEWQRPKIFAGITSHGVKPQTAPFAFSHTGRGMFKVAPMAIPSIASAAHSHSFAARHYTTDSEEAVRSDQSNPALHIPPESNTTDSEASVRADSELFDLPREPQPTDSEESVRADSAVDTPTSMRRKPDPTESEADVKADYSDFELEHKPQPTESEEDVRADVSKFSVNGGGK